MLPFHLGRQSSISCFSFEATSFVPKRSILHDTYSAQVSVRSHATPRTHVETGLLDGSAGAAGCVFVLSVPSVPTGALGATTLNTVVHRLLPSLTVTFMPEYNFALSIALPVSLRRMSRAEAPALASSGRRSCKLPKPRVDQVLSCDGVTPLSA